MSVTSQLKKKSSPIWQFLNQHIDTTELAKCTKYLQDLKCQSDIDLRPVGNWVYATIGTIADYLIRYSAGNWSLDYENTIAAEAVGRIDLDYEAEIFNIKNNNRPLKAIYEYGKKSLEENHGITRDTILGATAFSILDGFIRAESLPKSFINNFKTWNDIEMIFTGKNNQKEYIKIDYLMKKYIKSLFKVNYSYMTMNYYSEDDAINDFYEHMENILYLFDDNFHDKSGKHYEAVFESFNNTLSNSTLVGGADYDCIIRVKNKLILTDIKTIFTPLNKNNVLQIIIYYLLFDANNDGEEPTDLGIYYSRTGSYKYLNSNRLIKRCFPYFNNTNDVRNSLIKHLRA